MRPDHQRRRLLKSDLQDAIANKELAVHYQPIRSIASGEIVAFEALLRWFHPKLGCVSPGEFIPLAEETGAIRPLGLWVLETACVEAMQWPARIKLAVNVSPVQLHAEALPTQVASVLDKTKLSATRLDLEITEGQSIDSIARVQRTMALLKQAGIGIVLDDFGSGNSSLSHLCQLPVDQVKLDLSLIRSITDDRKSRTIVDAAIALAHRLEMTVVGEGIETEPQLACLRTLDCDAAQGFLLGGPTDASNVASLIADIAPSPASREMAFLLPLPLAGEGRDEGKESV
jgi:EAL domain-containing protein (putative c-di-GMP-specific phosphodiesterase class I)